MDEEQNEKKFNSAVFFLINKPLRWTEYLKQKYGKEYFKLIIVYRVICDLAWHKKVDIPAGQPLITTYRELGCILALSPSKIKKHLEKLENTAPPLIKLEIQKRKAVKIYINYPISNPTDIIKTEKILH